ncbi:hypothetical protein [Oleomonas cavernae]|nr:hypothetical protein [Oleomonas cavernae]
MLNREQFEALGLASVYFKDLRPRLKCEGCNKKGFVELLLDKVTR